MSAFADLDEFFDPTLTLPIRGVDYVIEPPSVTEVIKLRLLFADPEEKATAVDRLVWQAQMLGATIDSDNATVDAPEGSVWAQMEADGVSGEEILRAGNTALLRFGIDPAVAGIFWGAPNPAASGDDEGKGQGSNRKQRRAAPRKRAPKKT